VPLSLNLKLKAACEASTLIALALIDVIDKFPATRIAAIREAKPSLRRGVLAACLLKMFADRYEIFVGCGPSCPLDILGVKMFV
jgi:hypothetical protein